jgi:hypothetical protein
MTEPLKSEDTKVLAELRDTARKWDEFYSAQDRLAEVNGPPAASDGSYGLVALTTTRKGKESHDK